MSEQNGQNGTKPQAVPEGITKITVGGYKSIVQEQSIEIRPLTILAGANSSGKSSIMQPLLLLKQTLEAPYDPGPLLLDGPNVNFTSASQLLSHVGSYFSSNNFFVQLENERRQGCGLRFIEVLNRGFDIQESTIIIGDKRAILKYGLPHSKIVEELRRLDVRQQLLADGSYSDLNFTVVRNQCFLEIWELDPVITTSEDTFSSFVSLPAAMARGINLNVVQSISASVRNIIHLPGLRGNPARTYPVASTAAPYKGTFESYVASLIMQWQSDGTILTDLVQQLWTLGLTNMVAAEAINAAQIELRVGRSVSSYSQDTVSIADVGIGVSQTLPVLVALLAAKPGQLVYIEQPEIHLHPRAQTAMAQVLADAAMRGVRVVAETHSSLLLLGVQTLVAEGKLPPELVKLHWFKQGGDGATTILSADLDEGGAFGDWPEDFGDVSLDAQDRFLDAAEKHLLGT